MLKLNRQGLGLLKSFPERYDFKSIYSRREVMQMKLYFRADKPELLILFLILLVLLNQKDLIPLVLSLF